jgi:hypothetical protein
MLVMTYAPEVTSTASPASSCADIAVAPLCRAQTGRRAPAVHVAAVTLLIRPKAGPIFGPSAEISLRRTMSPGRPAVILLRDLPPPSGGVFSSFADLAHPADVGSDLDHRPFSYEV